MAGFAYVAPPLSGLIAYFASDDPRMRWHGLQAIVLGLVWPAGLYVGALVSATATQIAGASGAAAWLVLGVGAALRRDPSIPILGRTLRAWASVAPRDPL